MHGIIINTYHVSDDKPNSFGAPVPRVIINSLSPPIPSKSLWLLQSVFRRTFNCEWPGVLQARTAVEVTANVQARSASGNADDILGTFFLFDLKLLFCTEFCKWKAMHPPVQTPNYQDEQTGSVGTQKSGEWGVCFLSRTFQKMEETRAMVLATLAVSSSCMLPSRAQRDLRRASPVEREGNSIPYRSNLKNHPHDAV